MRLELDLIEERILSEGAHPYRRDLDDGTVVDLSSYDATGRRMPPPWKPAYQLQRVEIGAAMIRSARP